MNIIARFPHGTALYEKIIQPVRDGVFVVIKTSQEVYGVSRPTHNGAVKRFLALPDMWAITPENQKLPNGKPKPHYLVMTEDFCHWLFRLNVERHKRKKFESEQAYRDWHTIARNKNSPEHQYIRWWVSLMKGDRSHTNRYGSDTNYDPISGENEGRELMRYFQVVTGRGVLKLVKNRGDKFGVEVINMSKGDYRNYHPDTHWWLFDQPIMTGRKQIGTDNKGSPIWDENLIVQFPQFEPTRPIMPVILPYDSVGWVTSEYARLLGDEPMPSKSVL